MYKSPIHSNSPSCKVYALHSSFVTIGSYSRCLDWGRVQISGSYRTCRQTASMQSSIQTIDYLVGGKITLEVVDEILTLLTWAYMNIYIDIPPLPYPPP